MRRHVCPVCEAVTREVTAFFSGEELGGAGGRGLRERCLTRGARLLPGGGLLSGPAGASSHAGDEQGAVPDFAGVEEQLLPGADRAAEGENQRLKPRAVLPFERKCAALCGEAELATGDLSSAALEHAREGERLGAPAGLEGGENARLLQPGAVGLPREGEEAVLAEVDVGELHAVLDKERGEQLQEFAAAVAQGALPGRPGLRTAEEAEERENEHQKGGDGDGEKAGPPARPAGRPAGAESSAHGTIFLSL